MIKKPGKIVKLGNNEYGLFLWLSAELGYNPALIYNHKQCEEWMVEHVTPGEQVEAIVAFEDLSNGEQMVLRYES